MDILVTGATGYVGEAVSTRLVREGHTVTGLTRDASSSRSTTLREAGIRMVSGDVGDPTTYREHLGAADVVVHTVTDSMRPSDADRDLFHELSAVSARGGAPHLIYTTGCSVYGAHSHRVLTEETPTDADHPRATLERELQASGLRHTIVRPAFVFGGDGRSSLLGRWLDADRDDVGMFYGDPTKEWSWVHVDDLARGYAAIVDRLPELDGETFLLADEAPFRALETFEAAMVVTHPAVPVVVAPIEEEHALYRVFDRHEVVDARKAQERLQWTAQEDDVLDFTRGRSAPHRG
jgi:nucleoside-diphosphate-sugar epimerase